MNPYYFTVGPNAPMPPEVINLVDQVLETIGGEPHRFIFRKLGKRQSLPPHVDDMLDHEYDWRRFQVPIITDPNIVMRWPDDNQEVHLEAGNLYEVRADRLHEVVNNADIERVQLQIDQINATI